MRVAGWAALLCLLALAGCADGSSSVGSASSTGALSTSAATLPAASPEPSTPTPTADSSVRRRTGTTLISSGSEFGPMLYDASGQPVYLFTAESGSSPACYGDCAEDWPPVLTSGAARAAAGVRAGLLGTTRRSGGDTQVTYDGHPLYYYAHEGKYQVLCHDVDEYGGTWLVVRPDGRPAPG